jgi:hypothetical protein
MSLSRGRSVAKRRVAGSKFDRYVAWSILYDSSFTVRFIIITLAVGVAIAVLADNCTENRAALDGGRPGDAGEIVQQPGHTVLPGFGALSIGEASESLLAVSAFISAVFGVGQGSIRWILLRLMVSALFTCDLKRRPSRGV